MQLNHLPCLDSLDHAEARRRELQIPRERAAALGQSAVDAILQGDYTNAQGQRVVWQPAIVQAMALRRSIPPDELLPTADRCAAESTRVQVVNETTLAAAERLTRAGATSVLALNFANGVHPGGGFLHGARAQEEVLCRSSALYATLEGDPMYAAHQQRPLPDSTDWAIYSPLVPVFRRDDGTPLDAPWLLSFLTCAAPYAPRVGQPRSGDLLHQRIHRVLAIAHAMGHDALVLGAWGCGAFGNDPRRTAESFRTHLEQTFPRAFDDVVFAITDWSPERATLGPFREVFGQPARGTRAARLIAGAPRWLASLRRGNSGFPQQQSASTQEPIENSPYPPRLWITLWVRL
ncbi:MULTISPECIES: TIGR02452 family protein [Thiorhodovibrio]|uniref:TIGR02452 family protein n=1 Tax=Thiorhodovibrio TaxID=61593 RepID=UPI0019143383|nr:MULTISPECIES: TIGR02452 family protein [Thiorhodovibrio]MBK5970632.1 TIGR02452 family protein [Thiorhodovibrio winogradskyi]WPL12448.1 hypothetical protein Thiosp_02214 [Thiorhodovibrio litoralis]